jgi:alpha-1,2-mannosyltransferase
VWLLPTVVGVVAVVLAWLRWIDPSTWNLVDLDVFVRGGEAVLHGGDPYGGPADALEFTYPPFAAVVFVPLALLGGTAAWVMSALSLGSLVVVAWISLREARPAPEHGRTTSLGWLAALVLVAWALEPVQRTFIFGQVNLVLCALVLLDAFVVPPRFRGYLTGLAAGIKLTPAFFVVYFAVRRDWPAVARSAASGALSVAIGWLVLPAESARYWLDDLTTMGKFGGYALEPTNQSLRAMWVRLLGGDPGPWYLVSAAAVVVLVVWVARRLTRAQDPLAALAAVAAGSLLVSPISWTHHWVWVVPALVVMARRGWRVATGVVALLMYLPPMWAADGDPLRLSPVEQLVASTYVFLALGFLVALAVSSAPTPARTSAGRERSVTARG